MAIGDRATLYVCTTNGSNSCVVTLLDFRLLVGEGQLKKTFLGEQLNRNSVQVCRDFGKTNYF